METVELVNNGGSMTDKLYTYGNMPDKTGGAAFPVPATELHGTDTGMSLRDYLAAKAMQGILANPGQLDNVTDEAAKWVACDSYRMADAMLKARG